MAVVLAPPSRRNPTVVIRCSRSGSSTKWASSRRRLGVQKVVLTNPSLPLATSLRAAPANTPFRRLNANSGGESSPTCGLHPPPITCAANSSAEMPSPPRATASQNHATWCPPGNDSNPLIFDALPVLTRWKRVKFSLDDGYIAHARQRDVLVSKG